MSYQQNQQSILILINIIIRRKEKIMKMIIDKNVLLNSLNSVSKALSTRNIIPVLNGIKIYCLRSKFLKLEIELY